MYTVKLLTTSKRYHRLAKDLDINAGEYLNGKPLYQLTRETYQYVHRVAEGYRTFGERAGHSQVLLETMVYCRFRFGGTGIAKMRRIIRRRMKWFL